jgi:hypothetical protein
MRTYQHTAFIVFDRYDILYGGQKSDAGVGSGRRRRFLYWYWFRFSTTLWKVFVIEVRDSVVFSVIQTVFSTFDAYCAYGSAHTFSHLNYPKTFCILPFPRLSFARFWLVWVRLGCNTVGKICFVFDFILLTVYIIDARALTSILPSLSLINMIYCTAATKATPASVQCVVVNF